MITNFLSNKLNLTLMICLGYILLGYMMDMNNILFSQQILMLVIMFIIHMIGHILGVSRGIFIATVHKKELNSFLKMIDEYEKDGKPIDLKEIDKIVKDKKEEK